MIHPHDDGFGQMLLDCWTAVPSPHAFHQVIERDDGWVSVEDAYRYFTRFDGWVEPEQLAAKQAGGRVLDVGCAAGRHAIVMAGNGCEVVGIDPSPGAIEVARKRGIDARHGTILDPGDDIGTFDTIVLLGGNLGLLGSCTQATTALYRMAAVSRPGARLLGVGHDPCATTAPEHLAYHEANRRRGLLLGQVRMRLRYRAWASDWFDRLLLSPDELADLVPATPWRLDSVTPHESGFYLAEMTRGEMGTR